MKGVLVRAVALGIGLLLAGMFIVGWYEPMWGSSRLETNDAQLRGDPTRMSNQVAGRVVKVAVTDNQVVRAGDLLYSIEDDDYRAQVARAAADVAAAEAGVTLAVAQVASQRAQVGVAEAAVRSTSANLERARLERVRQAKLLGTESGLRRAWEAAVADERQYAATLQGDQSALGAVRANIQVMEAQADQARATLKAQRAALELAQVNLGYTRIDAPVSGVVGSRLVRAGQYVPVGTLLITLVPSDSVWVVANYREGQLTTMRVGQPAEVRVDAFSEVLLRGRVDSIQPASQARSSLMPPDRALGNFTKIVQRIPVKITLDRDQPLAGRLVPGLSAVATVNAAAAAQPGDAP